MQRGQTSMLLCQGKDTGSRKGLGPEHRSFQIFINWAMSADNDYCLETFILKK